MKPRYPDTGKISQNEVAISVVDWRNSDVKERPIPVEAHGKSWLEHDLTTAK